MTKGSVAESVTGWVALIVVIVGVFIVGATIAHDTESDNTKGNKSVTECQREFQGGKYAEVCYDYVPVK